MKKRLYRSKDRKLCGVCGGIAEYLDADRSRVVRKSMKKGHLWGTLRKEGVPRGGSCIKIK